MEINSKNITKWSSKKETYYTYYHDKLGELKVKVIETFNDKDELSGVTDVRISRDNYCIPELVHEVLKIHHKEDYA
jgi:hypothetical protein